MTKLGEDDWMEGAEERALARRIGEWYAVSPAPEHRARHVGAIVDALAPPAAFASRPAGVSARRRPGRWRVLGMLAGSAAALALVFPAARRYIGGRPASLDSPPPVAGAPARGVVPGPAPTREVGFELQLPEAGARRVTVAGDFNGWDAAALPMRRVDGGGVWRVRVALPPGRHAYSFVVDGERWVIDPLAPRTDEGALGPTNVITVSGES